jgi:hypothetical protein
MTRRVTIEYNDGTSENHTGNVSVRMFEHCVRLSFDWDRHHVYIPMVRIKRVDEVMLGEENWDGPGAGTLGSIVQPAQPAHEVPQPLPVPVAFAANAGANQGAGTAGLL